MDFISKRWILAIKAGNFEMYYKQQETLHQLYTDRCGNKTLIETIAKLKNKLLKKSYTDDPDGKMKDVFYSTNDEHRKS